MLPDLGLATEHQAERHIDGQYHGLIERNANPLPTVGAFEFDVENGIPGHFAAGRESSGVADQPCDEALEAQRVAQACGGARLHSAHGSQGRYFQRESILNQKALRNRVDGV